MHELHLWLMRKLRGSYYQRAESREDEHVPKVQWHGQLVQAVSARP